MSFPSFVVGAVAGAAATFVVVPVVVLVREALRKDPRDDEVILSLTADDDGQLDLDAILRAASVEFRDLKESFNSLPDPFYIRPRGL